MKKMKLLFIPLIGVLLLMAESSPAQWVQTNGPYGGGSIYSVAVSGENVFAGTDVGIYRSTDYGKTWRASGLAYQWVSELAAKDSIIFAGTDGVYRSMDNGMTWQYSGLSGDVSSIIVSGENIYAGGTTTPYRGFLYRSTDNGTNWTAIDSGLKVNGIWSVAVIGSNILAGTDSDGMFLSTNNGTSWQPINNGLDDHKVLSLAVRGTNIFAGTTQSYFTPNLPGDTGGVYLSTNNGASWQRVNNGFGTRWIRYTLLRLSTRLFLPLPKMVFSVQRTTAHIGQMLTLHLD